MRLRIVTPLSVVVDAQDVRSVRAEDASGSFGILPGHADFLTSLSISVVTWRCDDAPPRYCAVRQGVLTVSAGKDVAIATREAVVGDDITTLDATILAQFHTAFEAEQTERVETTRLQLNAIRQIMTHLRAATTNGWAGP